MLIVGFAASGFAALVLELAWIRALILVIGSSVYAFSATLATYLAGLGAGSLLAAKLLSNKRYQDRWRWTICAACSAPSGGVPLRQSLVDSRG